MKDFKKMSYRNNYVIKNQDLDMDYEVNYYENINNSYAALKATFKIVDDIFAEFVKKNNRKSTRAIYKKYLDFPKLPKKVNMSEKEIRLKTNYIIDHFPLLLDMRNEKEFHALSIIFREFKVSMKMKKCEEELPLFTKIVSLNTNINNELSNEVVGLIKQH